MAGVFDPLPSSPPPAISSRYFSRSQEYGKLSGPVRQKVWIQAGWEEGAQLDCDPS